MGTKKKRIILIITIVASLLIASGAYLGWRYWQEQQQVPAATESPESAEPIVNPEIDYDRINNLADEINASRGEE